MNIHFRRNETLENWYSINVDEPQGLNNYNSDFKFSSL